MSRAQLAALTLVAALLILGALMFGVLRLYAA
jgi:hypothetical protein